MPGVTDRGSTLTEKQAGSLLHNGQTRECKGMAGSLLHKGRGLIVEQASSLLSGCLPGPQR